MSGVFVYQPEHIVMAIGLTGLAALWALILLARLALSMSYRYPLGNRNRAAWIYLCALIATPATALFFLI